MIVYIVTCNNRANGERYLDCVWANEDEVVDYIENKNSNLGMNGYYYDYCAMQLKGRLNETIQTHPHNAR